MHRVLCSIFPNCVAKPKGERQAYIGSMLLDSKEISQLTLKRPFDRVSSRLGATLCAVHTEQQRVTSPTRAAATQPTADASATVCT